jgi:AsmA protein
MKWVKRLLWAIAVFVVVLIAAAVVLVVAVDPNDYKELIVKQVDQATGRQLDLEGDIKLSFFPWLGLRVGSTQLSNAQGFGDAPFARIDEAQLRVAILPLFKGEVRADTLRLHGLRLNLSKNAQGVTNWDDLLSRQQAPPPAESEAGQANIPSALAIGGIEIKDAALRWQDAQSGTELMVSPFNLYTDAISLGEPFDLQMDLYFKNKAPAMGVKLDLDGSITLDPANQRYQIKGLTTTVEAQGESLPGKELATNFKTDIDADLQAQTLRVAPLSLEALTLKLSGKLEISQLLGNPKVIGQLKSEPFSPQEVLSALDQALPPSADPNVLERASLDLGFGATSTQAELTRLAILLDDTQLTGSGKVKSFEEPEINFSLAVNQLDVDRYLPPAPQTSEQPANPPPSQPTDDRLPVPLEPLRGLNVKGDLTVTKLKAANLRLADLKASVTAKNGLLELRPVTTSLYKGQVSTVVKLDARTDTPAFGFNAQLKNVAIGDLMYDLQKKAAYLAGTGNVAFDLNTRGDRISSLKKQLNGKANLAVTKGALRDPELASKVERVVAYLKGRNPAPSGQEILFDSLQGSAVITNGVARNNDLALVTSLILAKGKGDVDVGKDTIDYELGVALAGSGQPDKKRLFVPITVKGPFTDLKYGLDLGKVAKQQFKEKADKEKQKLEEKLDRKIEKGKEDLQKKLEKQLQDKFKLF